MRASKVLLLSGTIHNACNIQHVHCLFLPCNTCFDSSGVNLGLAGFNILWITTSTFILVFVHSMLLMYKVQVHLQIPSTVMPSILCWDNNEHLNCFLQGLKCNSKHWPCLDLLCTVLYAVGDYYSKCRLTAGTLHFLPLRSKNGQLLSNFSSSWYKLQFIDCVGFI